MHPSGEQLTHLAKLCEDGVLKPLVGRTINYVDIPHELKTCRATVSAARLWWISRANRFHLIPGVLVKAQALAAFGWDLTRREGKYLIYDG